jgi:hypothetical protein
VVKVPSDKVLRFPRRKVGEERDAAEVRREHLREVDVTRSAVRAEAVGSRRKCEHPKGMPISVQLESRETEEGCRKRAEKLNQREVFGELAWMVPIELQNGRTLGPPVGQLFWELREEVRE